jgi:acetylornithine deacetylase
LKDGKGHSFGISAALKFRKNIQVLTARIFLGEDKMIIASYELELLQLLQNLIRIESVNPNLDSSGNGEAAIGKFVAAQLTSLGLDVHLEDLGNQRMNVIGVLKGTGEGKCLMLNGHMDTVGTQGMEIEPYNPTYADGKIYGRGSLDMKAGLAAIIKATESVIASGVQLSGDVLLAFVADEEYASIGSEAVVRKYSADAGIICEPTNLNISIAHKGFVWIDVKVFGKAAHGSRFHEGVDAIVKAGKFLVALERFESDTLMRRSHRLLDPPSIHASIISGGTGLSTYPDYCEVKLERRTIPGETPVSVKKEIDELISNLSAEDEQFRATVDVFFDRSPLEVSEDQPIVQAISSAYQSVLRREPVYVGTSGWLDSAIFADVGIPTISFGPSGEGLHASVEYVDFESVVSTTQVLAKTIVDFCT